MPSNRAHSNGRRNAQQTQGGGYDLFDVVLFVGSNHLVWHILVAKKEFLRISPEDSRVVEEEVKLGGTLKRIEFWGKTLTATSAAMAVIAGAVFVYHLLAV
jgi:hypothetical protein